MGTFAEMIETTEKKLNRDLCEEELVFLQWVYERYKQERDTLNTTIN